MAGTWVTGACLIYVGVPSAIAPTVRMQRRRNLTGSFVASASRAMASTRRLPEKEQRFLSGGSLSLDLQNRQFARSLSSRPIPLGPRLNNGGASEQTVRLLLRAITPVFLGTCEDYPDVRFHSARLPYHTDTGGPLVPHEEFWCGESATVVADLTFFNENLYALLAQKAGNGRISPRYGRGWDGPGHVGTMLVKEQSALPLWLVFPYASKPLFAGMPPGYRFFASTPDDEGLGPLSTRPRKLRLSWHCMRVPLTGGSRGYLLYDHDMRTLPPVEF